MKDKVMPDPSRADWIRIADEFQNRANFPNCSEPLRVSESASPPKCSFFSFLLYYGHDPKLTTVS
nr:unnamed protein product [Callosobruchus analis]